MKSKKKISLLNIILLMVLTLIVSCAPKSNGRRRVNNSTSSNSGVYPATNNGGTGSNGGTGNPNEGNNSGCHASGNGTGASYYNFQNIIAHGDMGTTYLWRSSNAPSLSGVQSRFATDGKFQVRILAHAGPGQQTPDSYGNTCYFDPLPYGELKVKVGIRVQGSPSQSYYETRTFSYIPVDGCSEVHSFNAPISNYPIEVDIISVNQDYTCTTYGDLQPPAYCPWYKFLPNDCFELSLQVGTSWTNNIPD